MYVFQCDRCGSVGDPHEIDLSFFMPTRSGRDGKYSKALTEEKEGENNADWQLCKNCTDAMAHFMHQPDEYGDVTTAVVDDLKRRVLFDLENLGANPDWTMKDLASNFVDACRQKMVLDRLP